MSDEKLKRKLRSADGDDESKVIIKFLKSAEFSEIVDSIVKTNTNHLLKLVEKLETDVTNLVETNKEMIKLLSDNTVHQLTNSNVNNKNYLNLSNSITRSDETVIEKTINVEKTIAQNMVDKNRFILKDTHIDKNCQDNQDRTQDWNKTNNKNKQKVVVGSAVADDDDNEQNSFSSSENYLWLHLDRCNPQVTTEDVKTYLEKRCPEGKSKGKSVVQILRKTGNPSFKIGVPKEMEAIVLEGSFWPKGVIIRQFDFFQHRQASRHKQGYSRNRQFYDRNRNDNRRRY